MRRAILLAMSALLLMSVPPALWAQAEPGPAAQAPTESKPAAAPAEAKPATEPQAQEKSAMPQFDEELAKSVGADEHGMRRFVLVILKTGPTRVPDGPERDEMFKGHFANMGRLADVGVLALAGPLDGVDGWRGLFVLAVEDIETARQHVATDPVIIKGEMVAEYHKLFASAALMLVNDAHKRIQEKPF